MAAPLRRRRSTSEDDAPSADKYSGRRGRAAEEEDDDSTERRPRRGRGELPDPGKASTRSRRGREEEPEDEAPRSSRRRGRDPEPEPQDDAPDFPSSKRALSKVTDEEFNDLAEYFELGADATEDDIWEAIEEAQADEPEDEPEPPRRSRGRRSEPEPEEEDEKPARGRASRRRQKDDDEDEAPKRGRGRGRSSRDDDDEPKGGKARRGFEGFKKTKSETYTDVEIKLNEDDLLSKFIDDEPFAAYGEHGLYDQLAKEGGQRVWLCLKTRAETPVACPICATGHEARPVGLFNIVVMPEEGDPELRVLKAGPKLMGILEKKGGLKTGPLSKEYYALSQINPKKGPTEYGVEVVRERDFEEDDWPQTPLTDDEIADFEADAYDEDYVKWPKLSEVREIARRLVED